MNCSTKKIDSIQHYSNPQEVLITSPTTPPYQSEDEEEKKKKFCHPDRSHITTWLVDVAKGCNPVEEQSAVWPLDEIPQPPLQPRTTWEEWDNPPDRSKFSSTNWATWIIGSMLDRPALPTEPSV